VVPVGNRATLAQDAEIVQDSRRARLLLWLAFWTMILSVAIGLPWDAGWHASRPFETPFSPPHLFIYATSALTVGLYLMLLTSVRLRQHFGAPIRVALVPFEVPGSLALIGAGLLVLAAAILDIVWHGRFGLDETRWSTPHAMLAWGWATAALGFVSARLALREHQLVHWWTRAFIGLILIGFTAAPLLGPFQTNPTRERVEAVAAIPILAEQPAYQHTARIYREWSLTRSNPLFAVLGGLWVGMLLGVLRIVERRIAFVVGLLAVWTLLTTVRDRGTALRLGIDLAHWAAWLPIPVLPAALVWAVGWRVGLGGTWATPLAGATFGVLSQLIWPSVGVLPAAALGAGACVLGEMVGARLGTILEKPTSPGCLEIATTAVSVPFLTGLADLYLRLHTP